MIPKTSKKTYNKKASNIFVVIFALMAILGMISTMSPDTVEGDMEPGSTESLQTRSTYSGYLLRIMVVTVTMVIILIVGLKIYNKQMRLKGKNNLSVTMLGRHYINDKQYLLKVFIEDRHLLLSVSDANINFLTELEAPGDEEEEEAEKDQSFGTILDLETNKESKV